MTKDEDLMKLEKMMDLGFSTGEVCVRTKRDAAVMYNHCEVCEHAVITAAVAPLPNTICATNVRKVLDISCKKNMLRYYPMTAYACPEFKDKLKILFVDKKEEQEPSTTEDEEKQKEESDKMTKNNLLIEEKNKLVNGQQLNNATKQIEEQLRNTLGYCRNEGEKNVINSAIVLVAAVKQKSQNDIFVIEKRIKELTDGENADSNDQKSIEEFDRLMAEFGVNDRSDAWVKSLIFGGDKQKDKEKQKEE